MTSKIPLITTFYAVINLGIIILNFNIQSIQSKYREELNQLPCKSMNAD